MLTNASKLNELSYEGLPLPYSLDLLPLLQAYRQFFCRENASNQQETENAFQEFIESQSMDFLLQELTNLFLIGKKVLIVVVPILINKDMLKPSYNDLKVMVQNHNYVYTNLIT